MSPINISPLSNPFTKKRGEGNRPRNTSQGSKDANDVQEKRKRGFSLGSRKNSSSSAKKERPVISKPLVSESSTFGFHDLRSPWSTQSPTSDTFPDSPSLNSYLQANMSPSSPNISSPLKQAFSSNMPPTLASHNELTKTINSKSPVQNDYFSYMPETPTTPKNKANNYDDELNSYPLSSPFKSDLHNTPSTEYTSPSSTPLAYSSPLESKSKETLRAFHANTAIPLQINEETIQRASDTSDYSNNFQHASTSTKSEDPFVYDTLDIAPRRHSDSDDEGRYSTNSDASALAKSIRRRLNIPDDQRISEADSHASSNDPFYLDKYTKDV